MQKTEYLALRLENVSFVVVKAQKAEIPEISYLTFPSVTISLKAKELRKPAAIRTAPPIQATNSAGPKLHLQRQK